MESQYRYEIEGHTVWLLSEGPSTRFFCDCQSSISLSDRSTGSCRHIQTVAKRLASPFSPLETVSNARSLYPARRRGIAPRGPGAWKERTRKEEKGASPEKAPTTPIDEADDNRREIPKTGSRDAPGG